MSDRSPDVAWIKLDRWEALTTEEQEKFPPICPDFVIELMSRTDALKPLQEKMQEYLNSGLRLGWLINPQDEQVAQISSGLMPIALNRSAKRSARWRSCSARSSKVGIQLPKTSYQRSHNPSVC
jgi:Uma2 family endonuclease